MTPVRLFLALLLALSVASAASAEPKGCAVGTYRLGKGDTVDVAPSNGAQLRWRRTDGTTGALTRAPDGTWASTLGWTGRPDGRRIAFDCARGAISFDGASGRRLAFDVTETRFEVGGATLAGRLILPKGDGPVPIVILIHGAERDSAREAYALQRLFPAAGIGAFVYDKRGTGGSSGNYTHDYLTLAVDAVAAVHEARRLAGPRAGRVGYQAGSQGGWVAPLAARIEPVDFIIVSFGLAVSPVAGERELITAEMEGYGPEILAKAMRVADAVDAVIASGFRDGYHQLDAVRRDFAGEPWFAKLRGSYTAMILGMSNETLKADGPGLVPHIPAHYDPMPVLRNLDVPQLWILGGDDIVAPPGETSRRLSMLADSGRPITTAIFAGADHGMYAYEVAADGSRVSTRAPAGYFPMMRDFIAKGRIEADYGAEIVGRAHRSR